jgi:hypothetical protein
MQILAAPFISLAGDYQSIATTTVGVAGATEIIFSAIPSTYKHLQIRGMARNSTTEGNLRMQLNSDSSTNYSYHQITGTGASASSAAATSASYTENGNMPTTTSMFATYVIDILDYADTNKFKTIRTLAGFDTNATERGLVQFLSGNWRSTSAITTVRLFAGNNSMTQYSQFALYGIKG